MLVYASADVGGQVFVAIAQTLLEQENDFYLQIKPVKSVDRQKLCLMGKTELQLK